MVIFYLYCIAIFFYANTHIKSYIMPYHRLLGFVNIRSKCTQLWLVTSVVCNYIMYMFMYFHVCIPTYHRAWLYLIKILCGKLMETMTAALSYAHFTILPFHNVQLV